MLSKSISSLLRREVVTIPPGSSVGEAVAAMRTRGISCVLVADGGRPVGIVTERDLTRMVGDGRDHLSERVETVMSAPVRTIHAGQSFFEVLEIFREGHIRHLAVVDDAGMLTGIVTETDLFTSLEALELLQFVRVGALVAGKENVSIPPRTSLHDAIALMHARRIGSLVTVDADGRPVGVLTEHDIPALLSDHVDLAAVTVGEAVPPPSATVLLAQTSFEALTLMTSRRIWYVAAVDDDGRLAGVVSRSDFTKGVIRRYIEDLSVELDRKRCELEEVRRRYVESRMRESELRYHTLFESVHDALFVVDDDGRILDCNDPALVLAGLGREELAGALFKDLVGGADQPRLETLLRASGAEGAGERGLFAFGGESRRGEVALTVIPLTLAGAAFRLVVAVDVTQAARLDRAREYLLSVTAHELRTPLVGLQAAADLLRTATGAAGADPSLTTALRMIDDSFERLDRISTSASLIATHQLAPRRERREPIPLRIVVGSAMAHARERALERRREVRLTLESTPQADLAEVPVHLELLFAALGEVYSNAIKYTRDGGVVTTRLRAEDGMAVVEVADEGVGIPGGLLRSVQEPFFSAENVAQHHTCQYDYLGGGMGLGLPFIRSVMAIHGGDLAIDSPGEGRGARVTLTFRRERSGEAAGNA